jgi:8-oxo-dGTP diphosphatase
MAGEKIDKLAWVCLKEGRILCARSKGKEMFYMPGGKREKGETDAQALARELKEELTIDIVPDSLKFVGIFEAQAHGKRRARWSSCSATAEISRVTSSRRRR